VIPQAKRLRDGQLARWTVDPAVLESVAPWAREAPALLRQELAELAEHFPTWIVTFGELLHRSGWPHAQLVPCPSCGELLVPDGKVRCLACRRSPPPAQLLVGYTGRLPAYVTGRRLLRGVQQRIRAARAAGREGAAALLASYFLTVGEQTLFAPPVWIFCPASFPHGEPMVMVHEDYFEILGITEEHVYHGTRWRLCNYATWPKVSVRTVLQQRIVPRILLDLMVADLAAAGTLDGVLRELGLSLHVLYNVAGRAGSLARFEELWAECSAC